MLNVVYHYPPELLLLLVDAIPRLCRSKRDVLLFFKGAGVPSTHTSDIAGKLKTDRDSVNKFEIVRIVLERLNDAGDYLLQQRREILKRVIEFENFSICWPQDQLEAKGLISEIRDVVNVKDSFTRMRQEREEELRRHRQIKDKEIEAKRLHVKTLEGIRNDLNSLFALQEPQARGKMLEDVLNRLFEWEGILLREAFTRVEKPGEGIIEQIDGAVEIEGHVYLVEMKWLKDAVGPGDVSQHLVRVFNRGGTRGIFISYSRYTPAAIQTCEESLSKAVIVLCDLQEIVMLMERGDSLREMLVGKINGAILDKKAMIRIL